MANRDRMTYDDMNTTRSGKGASDRKGASNRTVIVVVVLLGVAICIGVVIVWINLFSSPAPKPQPDALVIDAASVDTNIEEVQTTKPQTEVSAPSGDRPVSIPSVQTPLPSAAPVQRSQTSASLTYKEHIVQEGETLESIAQLYALSKETLISINRIRNVLSIKTGDVWNIPDQDGQLYTVQPGDSLSIITSRYNPTLGWKTLQEINGLNNEVIHPGQELFIPSAKLEDDGSFANYARFVKPVEGRIAGLYGQMVKYGTKDEPVVLQGIWIDASIGTSVRASGTGIVVDIGNEPEGFGRFIVLSHNDGYRTKYGHLNEIAVKVGDQVTQSSIIGTVGSSGIIDRPLLYFSLEQEGIALNPINFF